MRYSVDADDEGYPAYQALVNKGCVVDVKLNGKKIKRVVTADSDLGYAVVHSVNDEGYMYLDPRTGEAAVERVHGAIEFTVRPVG